MLSVVSRGKAGLPVSRDGSRGLRDAIDQFKSHLFMWMKKKPTIHEEAPTSSLDSRGTDRGTDIPSRDAETVKERE